MKKTILMTMAVSFIGSAFAQVDSVAIQNGIKTTVDVIGGVAESNGVPTFVTAIVSSIATMVGAFFIARSNRKKREKKSRRE